MSQRIGTSPWARRHRGLWIAAGVVAFSTATARGEAPRPLSPAWLAARANGTAAGSGSGAAGSAAGAAAIRQSLADMQKAAQALSKAQAAQATAAAQATQAAQVAAALGLTKVPNGLTTGGLVPDTSLSWQNANAPVQTQNPAATKTTVTVTQTAKSALLYWQSFNVGSDTNLVFDQSAGLTAANTWVALNRITDANAAPSQILGSITAPGQVYIINRNGIIFGGGAQVNTGALIASAADFAGGISGGYAGFLAHGIFSQSSSSKLLPAFGGDAATAPLNGAGVQVLSGAAIQTNAPASVLNEGGLVLLMGASVSNAGSISAPKGQVALAAGQSFNVIPGYTTSGSGDPLATTLGAEIAVTGGGAVSNSGLIRATAGDITLVGQTVIQAGVAWSTTTVNQRGTIHLLTSLSDTAGTVTLAPGSLTIVAPDLSDSTTALNAQRAQLISSSASNNAARLTTVPGLNDVAGLGDRLDQSRIEISAGSLVNAQANSLTMAQGGQIVVAAGLTSNSANRFFAEQGAVLDVSGVPGVVLPASANFTTVNIQSNELRDSPANRISQALAGSNVTVDLRNLTLVPASTAYPSDRYYTPGGLLEVSGYLNNIGHTIGEWAAVGGTITLSAGSVLAQQGAVFNIAGGSVAYQAGTEAQNWLISSTGKLYTVASAPATLTYTGLFNGFAAASKTWGVTSTFGSAVATPATIDVAAYTVGRDAGTLAISSPTVLFGAAVNAGVTPGASQGSARPASITDPFLLGQTVAPLAGALTLGKFSAVGLSGLYSTTVTIGGAAPNVLATLGIADALPAGTAGTAMFAADVINEAGLGGLTIATSAPVSIVSSLGFGPGALVSITAPAIAVNGSLTLPGGNLTLTNKLSVVGSAAFETTPGASGITVAQSAVIDARGVWSNAELDPNTVYGNAFAAGGSVTLDTSQGLALLAGSLIDVSAGGAFSAAGKFTGGKGGSVTLTTNDAVTGTAALAPLLLEGRIRGYGVTGGGTLSLSAPSVVFGLKAPAGLAAGALFLTPDFVRAGFGTYQINGLTGLTVLVNTTLRAVAPTEMPNAAAAGIPTFSDPSTALTVALQPLFTLNPLGATVIQRPGASLSLSAVQSTTGGGLVVGGNASVEVDPGRSVSLTAYNGIEIEGDIVAHGGSIAIVNTRFQDATNSQLLSLYVPGQSIWIGSEARLDVRGVARTGFDQSGLPFGIVQNGGSISIGGIGGTAGDGTNRSTAEQIIIRPGAILDASGARAEINPNAGIGGAANGLVTSSLGPTTLVGGAGGSVSLSSYAGIFNDGTLRAPGGSATAAGGTLSLAIEVPGYNTTLAAPPASILYPPEIVVSARSAPVLSSLFAPGSVTPESLFAKAFVSAEAVTQGGFGSVSLFARGLIAFDGSVTLRADQSITLTDAIFAQTGTSAAVRIDAPYVRLNGLASIGFDSAVATPLITNTWKPSSDTQTGTFTVNADLIDVQNDIRFGVNTALALPAGGSRDIILDGFAKARFVSTGDIRFLSGASSPSSTTSIVTNADVLLKGAQVYPASFARASVVAGYDFQATTSENPLVHMGRLKIRGTGAAPADPLSIGGSLSFVAGTVEQAGVVRAPLGSISLGAVGTATSVAGFGTAADAHTFKVIAKPGSETSVSAEGLTIPYGGTSDTISYTYNGNNAAGFNPVITVAGQSFSIAPGAIFDMRGGGTLTGGGGALLVKGSLFSQGFVAGRGGSTDVLITPLLQFNPSSLISATPALSTDPVYAILAGPQPGYAPVTPLDLSASYVGSLPGVGADITIGDGVSGLAAGTYTLLPSYYALLPGGYRVELAPGTALKSAAVQAVGNGTFLLPGHTGVAHTAIESARPVAVFVTPGAAVRTYSQYNEQSFTAFELAQAATFQHARPLLPADAGTLVLSYAQARTSAPALAFDGSALFAPGLVQAATATSAALNGYSGTLSVVGSQTTTFEITDGGPGFLGGTIRLSGAALDAIGAPRIVIGGTISYNPGAAGSGTQPSILLSASAAKVTIDSGAVLAAPDVFILATSGTFSGAITVSDGAIINTIGTGPVPYDSVSTGLAYDVQRNTALLVSNGTISLAPINSSVRAVSGPITIADGASLLSSGSVLLTSEDTVSIGAGAQFGTATLNLTIPVVNVGTPTHASVPVPAGLTLSQETLNRLLAGNPTLGAPALANLTLTASRAVNFYGSVQLSTLGAGGASGLQALVLNTPAIYGEGSAADAASLTTGTLIWNGVAGLATSTGTLSATPMGVVAGGAGTGLGSLTLAAEHLILGYPASVPPSNSAVLDRLILGFSTVALIGNSDITFNNKGSLSVFAQQAGSGAAGTGGQLSLVTPRFSGAAGARLSVVAGDTIQVSTPAGVAPVVTGGIQGAVLKMTAGAIVVNSALDLPAGEIALTATRGDITIGAAGRLMAAGPDTVLFDQTVHSGGGTVLLESATGTVVAAAGSVIDVSSAGAAGGTLGITAPAGALSLNGAIHGGAIASQDGGQFDLRLGAVADFAALNDQLDAGGFTQERRFDIGTGDLTVTGTVHAHHVSITASGGDLTVNGTINASGAAPGSIVLSAQGSLSLAATAVLDAHATVAQNDSSGAPIAAANRADVSLTARSGTLALAAGAEINVSSAAAGTFGTVELYAPRNGANDIQVSAAGPIAVEGAQSIALYGMRAYVPPGGVVAQAYLNAIDGDSSAFMAGALANTALLNRLAGLTAQGAAFHLRPGVEIDSATPDGNLTVQGELQLQSMRYKSLGGAAGTEPGALLLRAGGTLNVFGSISDGFAAPVDGTSKPNPDDSGWLLFSGTEPLGQNIVVPSAVTLAAGTQFGTHTSEVLNYPITIGLTALRPGVPAPSDVVVSKHYKVPVGGFVATAAIRDTTGAVVFQKGELVPQGFVIKSQWVLEVGSVVPFQLFLASGTVVPAGTSLAIFNKSVVTLSQSAALSAGSLIPAGTKVVLPDSALSVGLRTAVKVGTVAAVSPAIATSASTAGAAAVVSPVSGATTKTPKTPKPPVVPPTPTVQGSILATAALLPEGSLSWSIDLVGGSNFASANTQAVKAASVLAAKGVAGDILLSDPHYVNPSNPAATLIPRQVQAGLSVIRTGTGDLSLTAGGSITEASLFGIYTAGAQAAGVTSAYQQPRGTLIGGTTVLSTSGTGGFDYNTLLGGYQAWYPIGGGNVRVSAQGNLVGDVVSVSTNGTITYQSDAVGNWLWRQGGFAGQSAAWWINFGSYADTSAGQLALVGFSGIGALGGGNVTVRVGGNAGVQQSDLASPYTSGAIDVAVASTGRVTSVTGDAGGVTGGTIALTGGGNVSVAVGGILNPTNVGSSNSGQGSDLFGVLGSMRGSVTITAQAIGAVVPSSGTIAAGPYVASLANAYGGPLLLLADSSAQISAAGDLVLGGVIDPGRVATANTTAFSGTAADGTVITATGGGRTAFSLWQSNTAISLYAAGGTLVPTQDVTSAMVAADMNISYPPVLRAVAATGDIRYSANAGSTSQLGPAVELAPSPTGQLVLLAGGNINAAGLADALPLGLDISGAPAGPNAIPNPFRPATQGTYPLIGDALATVGNVTNPRDFADYTSLFAFEADTSPSATPQALHAGDSAPALIYAAGGNIIDLNFGETWRFVSGGTTLATWYLAAKPAIIRASNDILVAGTSSLLPLQSAAQPLSLKVVRNLILNVNPGDVSSIEAGQDIFYANFAVAGPGSLLVNAGHNIYQADRGSFYSVGEITGSTGGSRSNGAGVYLTAGTGASGPDWSNFLALYFDPANLADPAQTLSSTANLGKVAADYAASPALKAWMEAHYPALLQAAGGGSPTAAQTLAAFLGLTRMQQTPFLYQVLFTELAASGQEYAKADSLRYHSYLRGSEAVAAVFGTSAVAPTAVELAGFSSAQTAAWDKEVSVLSHLAAPASAVIPSGDITLFGGSGVTTQLGGAIVAVVPHGQLTLGLANVPPPTPASGQPAAGLITAGQGDVDVLTHANVVLGQSRIFTTYGGGITVWSSAGDIQVGVGSKTSQVFQPPRIDYDNLGDITLSPTSPTTGAGIATLAPVAGITAGDVTLAVPFGVIDLGEAGVRASGNVTIAGAVTGTGGIAAGGKTSGIAVSAAPNTGAMASAAAVGGAAASSGSDEARKRQQQQREVPSLITVEVISFGGA